MANEDGVWRTISGRRVFIRTGQSLTDAMRESGKFGPKKSDKAAKTRMWNREDMEKAVDLTKDIINEYDLDFEKFGLRMQEQDTEKVGEVMKHTSKNFGGDFEGTEREGEDLPGVSAIGVKYVHEIGNGAYEGAVMYLLGSNQYEFGYDPGEIILGDAVVLAKIGEKDGKLTVLERVPQNSASDTVKESSPKPSTNSYSGTKEQVNEYVSFKFQMEKKYGADSIWADMTDSEYEKLERLERIAYRGK